MRKNINAAAVAAIFFMMILSALCDNVRGVFIPAFKRDFFVKDTSIGIMLTACSLGYIIFTYVGGILCEKIGQKKVFMLGYGFIIISLIALYFSPNFYAVLLEVFFMNVGQALLAIGANTLIPIIFLSYQAILMNLTHFCYGIGAAVAPRTAGLLLYNGIAWRQIYLYIAIVAIVLFICFFKVNFPDTHKCKTETPIKMGDIYTNKIVYLYIFALGFYVFAEMGTGNWFVNYIQKCYGYNENKSSIYLAIFFGVFAFGRLIGGFIVEKLGYLNTVIVSLFIAAILYTAGIVMGKNQMIIVSISGLFFSIVFPTVILTISKVFKQSSAYITGIIVTFTSFISMVLNMLMGYLNDAIGVYKAYFIVPISLWISLIFMILIYKSTKNHLIIRRKKYVQG